MTNHEAAKILTSLQSCEDNPNTLLALEMGAQTLRSAERIPVVRIHLNEAERITPKHWTTIESSI